VEGVDNLGFESGKFASWRASTMVPSKEAEVTSSRKYSNKLAKTGRSGNSGSKTSELCVQH